jgi:hypothetical protein
MILKPICKSSYLGEGREKEEGLQERLPKVNLSSNHDGVTMGFSMDGALVDGWST